MYLQMKLRTCRQLQQWWYKTVLIAKWLLYLQHVRVRRTQTTNNQSTFLFHLTVCEVAVNMLPYMVCIRCGVGERLSTSHMYHCLLHSPHTGTQCAVMMCAFVPLTLKLFPDITHTHTHPWISIDNSRLQDMIMYTLMRAIVDNQ